MHVALRSIFVCGALLVLISTALINHADLFGLRQVWTFLLERHYFTPAFVSPGPYNIVRHPLYLGWILAFWATPHMTAGHLLFAVFMTAYIRMAISFEERDLLAEHGRKYRAYRRRVPMLIPFAGRGRGGGGCEGRVRLVLGFGAGGESAIDAHRSLHIACARRSAG